MMRRRPPTPLAAAPRVVTNSTHFGRVLALPARREGLEKEHAHGAYLGHRTLTTLRASYASAFLTRPVETKTDSLLRVHTGRRP
jgi:hypothetical protein